MSDQPADEAPEEPSEYVVLERIKRVMIPWGGGNELICPGCGKVCEPLRTMSYWRPPQFIDVLYEIYRCPNCRLAFAPKREALVIRS